MNSIALFIAVLLIALAVVMALPHDEAVFGENFDSENLNPEDTQQIFKLKKFKKLFLG
ncbi:CLUMA_CG001399, isoform A [Clunio marinus]|uniref:CLUMA_CG001399, isoform A n=1 Tax=Clunio marinus TaxID=568069 RepID=A0A1J1HI74_9DIPT|nr:CLUMA_CG001399, isoform A [Clunio marinus]